MERVWVPLGGGVGPPIQTVYWHHRRWSQAVHNAPRAMGHPPRCPFHTTFPHGCPWALLRLGPGYSGVTLGDRLRPVIPESIRRPVRITPMASNGRR